MLIDFALALWAGLALGSLSGFLVLMGLAMLGNLFVPQPGLFRSGLLRLALVVTGISIVLSLFGGGDGDMDA